VSFNARGVLIPQAGYLIDDHHRPRQVNRSCHQGAGSQRQPLECHGQIQQASGGTPG
jgi:hypothetical protein